MLPTYAAQSLMLHGALPETLHDSWTVQALVHQDMPPLLDIPACCKEGA